MFFTMPWSPTSEFPHPLGQVSYKSLQACEELNADEVGSSEEKEEGKKGGGTKSKQMLNSFLEEFRKACDHSIIPLLTQSIRSHSHTHSLCDLWNEIGDDWRPREGPEYEIVPQSRSVS